MLRSVIAAAVASSLLAPVAASAQEGFDPAIDIYPMVFPVAGDNHYSDTWGAPRGGDRTHEGTDIMADKMTPVVAVAAGTVGWMHDSIGSKCCAMSLRHDDGWESWYIHLNNDTPGTDDGLGWGFAPGIEGGVHVAAGQLIGYVGDSGNAESSGSHLHIELHMPGGLKINPYPHLVAALSSGSGLDLGSEGPCPEGATCDSVALMDGGARFRLMKDITWKSEQSSFYYGDPGDYPLMGDWDCDGIKTPAMYRTGNGFMYLRNSNTEGVADTAYFYGDASDIPLAGDFNGDGCDTLSIYRPTEGKVYIKNDLGSGFADYEFEFGNPGDKPFVGDFDGDGIATVGLHRETTGYVYFRNSNDTGIADFEFFYGDPGDKLIAGDWDGDGDDTVAVYRPATGMLYAKLDNTAGNADHTVPVGDGWVAALVAPGNHGEAAPPAETEPPPDAVTETWPPEVEAWRSLVTEHFPPELVEEALAIIWCESGGVPNDTNPDSGAAGLFQLIPPTWDWLAAEIGLGDYASGAPLDPAANTEAAAWLVQYSLGAGQSAWEHWACRP
jgi:hypothetical protein